jgi:hypothetical protein
LAVNVARWDDEVVIATNVARLALGSEIAKLQEIRRSTQALDGPTCFARARDLGVEYMNATIDLYVAFLGQQSTVGLTDVPQVTKAKFEDAVRSLRGSIGLTVTASPAPTPFRITRKAADIVISGADVGSDYVGSSSDVLGGRCPATRDCVARLYVTTKIVTGTGPHAILGLVVIFPDQGEAQSFFGVTVSARRRTGETEQGIAQRIGDEARAFLEADSATISLYVRFSNSVHWITLVGGEGSRLELALALAAIQVARAGGRAGVDYPGAAALATVPPPSSPTPTAPATAPAPTAAPISSATARPVATTVPNPAGTVAPQSGPLGTTFVVTFRGLPTGRNFYRTLSSPRFGTLRTGALQTADGTFVATWRAAPGELIAVADVYTVRLDFDDPSPKASSVGVTFTVTSN